MKLFALYIKQRWRILAASAVIFVIFFVSFMLYHLPVKAVIYPTALCVIFCLIMLITDFFKMKHRHDVLQSIQGITDVATGIFPSPLGICEEDYQKIIRLVCKEHSEYCTDANQRYYDMVDYYTAWAHQIKTPIASMRLHLQNEDSALSRKLVVDLSHIEQYVEMVMMFLKLDSESTDYVFKEYDLDSVIKQAIKKFAGEFIDRRLSLIYEPVNTTVITDEKWLLFVIEQILSNALKYTFFGSITIKMQTEKRLCICDTGIGIAPEDLPRIFEKGYTGYNGRRDKNASGIGLYLCRRILKKLGHTIKAESVVDEGTVIIIDFSQSRLEVE